MATFTTHLLNIEMVCIDAAWGPDGKAYGPKLDEVCRIIGGINWAGETYYEIQGYMVNPVSGNKVVFISTSFVPIESIDISEATEILNAESVDGRNHIQVSA